MIRKSENCPETTANQMSRNWKSSPTHLEFRNSRRHRKFHCARPKPPQLTVNRKIQIRASQLTSSQPTVPLERLLRVTTDYFCAGAVWKKTAGVWSCVLAAPILKWMVGMNPDSAKIALIKMDAQFLWISVNPCSLSNTEQAC